MSKNPRLALVGANGRMGREISRLVAPPGEFQISASLAIVRTGQTAGFAKTSTSLLDLRKADIDVVIDFSTLQTFGLVVDQCLKEKLPLVSGVTGLTGKEFQQLQEAAKSIPVLWAANMSVGMALFKKMVRLLAEQSGFEFQISESHHNKKKDAPSGTALDLQNALEISSGRTWPAPHSTRGGGIIGDHQLLAMAEEEVIEITHRALHRSVFARGALRAAEFLATKPVGLYKLEDLLK